MKRIFFFLLMLIPFIGFSQSNINANSITLAGNLGTSIKDTATFLCSGHPCPVGTLIISKTTTDTTLFLKQSQGWVSVNGSGGSSLYFKNGLKKRADSITVELGGNPLIKNTVIDGNTFGFDFSFSNILNLNLSGASINLNALSGVKFNQALFTGSASYTPIRLNSGSLTSPVLNGGFGYDGTHLYFAIGGSHRQLDQQLTNPAGSNTQIQFNNSGIFGASSSLIWNGSQIGIGSTLYGSNNITSISDYAIIPVNTIGSNGHLVDIAGGDVSSGVGNGGDVILDTGTGSGGGTNGRIRLNIVNDYVDISQTSGLMTFTGTNTSTTVGENVSLIAGSPSAGVNAGGNITLKSGAGFGGGSSGSININSTGSGSTNLGNSTGIVLINGDVTEVFAVSELDLHVDESTTATGFNLNPGSIQVASNDVSFSGINEAADYSVNYTPLSHTNKTYVDSQIAINIPKQGFAVLDFPNTTTGVSDLTISVSGAVITQPCTVGVPNGSVTATGSFWCWVSSANTVTVRFSPKAVGGENPASGTFQVRVFP